MSVDQSLGEYLRQEREKRGITIEQVASATKISIKLLHAIEADQYAELPAKPFVRGFVIAYCRFVGIDSKEVLTRFGAFIEQKAQERPVHESGHSGYAFERKEGDRSKTFLLVSILAFLAIGIVAIVVVKPALKKKRMAQIQHMREAREKALPSPTPTPSPTTTELPLVAVTSGATPSPSGSASPTPTPSVSMAVSPTPSPKPTPSATPSAPAPVVTPPAAPLPLPKLSPLPTQDPNRKPDPLQKGDNLLPNEVKEKVVLRADGDIWVRYQVDDGQVMELILRKGGVLVLKARAQMRFQVSDGNVVRIRHRTSDFQPLSARKDLSRFNEMTTVVIPAQPGVSIENPFKGRRELKTPPPSFRRAESGSQATDE